MTTSSTSHQSASAGRRLVVTQNCTLDLVVDMEAGWFDPAADGSDPEQLEVLRQQMAAEEVLLLGRQTFEDFRGYWPEQTDDTTGITDQLDTVRKVVVTASQTAEQLGWANSEVLDPSGGRDALLDAVRALKAEPGDGEIGLTGSITLLHALAGSGLVDEYRLFVYPLVVGRGARLLPDGVELRDLRLLEARAFAASGIAFLRYAAPTTTTGR